jgi:glutamate dehydrogenase/leucine dehydrogenase
MIEQLTLPSTVMRRNKLDISLGYCTGILPQRVLSLGPCVEVRVEQPAELIDFLNHDAEMDHVYFVNHLCADGNDKEWEYGCFCRHAEWTIFCAVFSTALAYNPLFGDGNRRRLCSGGTRIISKDGLEKALHRRLDSVPEALLQALLMDLDLAEAMTGKNLANGFNIGGSKTLVYVGDRDGQNVPLERARDFAVFMARFHNSIMQSLPLFVGTGSDLNFKEHGDLYYDLCSRISPNYVGNQLAARRWGRETAEDTTVPTAKGVIASIDAVSAHLVLTGDDRSILIKGLGGIGARVARYYVDRGWKVYATEVDDRKLQREYLGCAVTPVVEQDWERIGSVRIFSPNSASGSLTQENLPVLQRLGVRAVVGGENNIHARGMDEDQAYREAGILTFADFLLNGGGAWIVDAEMVERSVNGVDEWIESYQVPTVIRTIELARQQGRSPESIFTEFIKRKVKELLA